MGLSKPQKRLLILEHGSKGSGTVEYRNPIHMQLRELIREKIEEGEYKPGEMIPSERELSTIYGLNRITVRNAIAALVNEGLLKKVQGKGTFVIKPKIERDLYTLSGFGNTLLEKGVTPSTKLLYKGRRKAGKKFSRIFGIDPESEIYNITRLRMGENEPFALEDTYILFDTIENIEEIDFGTFSLYEAFKMSGFEPERAEQTLSLVKIDGVEAKLLQMANNSAVFLFECTSYEKGGKAVEFTRSYTRGDKCSFFTELK